MSIISRLPIKLSLKESIIFLIKGAPAYTGRKPVGNAVIKAKLSYCVIQSKEVSGSLIDGSETVRDTEIKNSLPIALDTVSVNYSGRLKSGADIFYMRASLFTFIAEHFQQFLTIFGSGVGFTCGVLGKAICADCGTAN